jgi:DNA replication protein DnaC
MLSALPAEGRGRVSARLAELAKLCAVCHGLGIEYLETRPRRTWRYCACACGARAKQQAEEERAASRQQMLAGMRTAWEKSLGIPLRMREWTLESYPYRARKWSGHARTWLQGWGWSRNLILTGGTGAGKTGLAAGMIRALKPEAVAGLKTVRFVVTPEWFDELYRSMGERDREQAFATVYERYAHCALLVLDDLGAERRTEWTDSRLYTLLNARYNRQLPTWLTTNLGWRNGQLAGWLSDRVVSRLTENGDVWEMGALDLRHAVKG